MAQDRLVSGDYLDIGGVGVGRAGDLVKTSEERLLKSKLERILWESEHDGPDEVKELLIGGLRNFVSRCNGVLPRERFHDEEGEWDILQSLPSTLDPNNFRCFLIRPEGYDGGGKYFRIVPQEVIIESQKQPALAASGVV